MSTQVTFQIPEFIVSPEEKAEKNITSVPRHGNHFRRIDDMKNTLFIHLLVQATLLIFVDCIAVIPAFIGAVTSPMHSPKLAEKTFCPEGTSIEINDYQATWNEPGENTISVSCVDLTGNHYSATEGNEGALFALIGKFFLISLGILFIPLSIGMLLVTRWATRAWSGVR